MVAVIKSPLHVFYVVAVFAVANQIETAVLSPRSYRDMWTPPSRGDLFAVGGSHIWGLLGMIVAVPLAGILRVLLRYTWTRIFEQ